MDCKHWRQRIWLYSSSALDIVIFIVNTKVIMINYEKWELGQKFTYWRSHLLIAFETRISLELSSFPRTSRPPRSICTRFTKHNIYSYARIIPEKLSYDRRNDDGIFLGNRYNFARWIELHDTGLENSTVGCIRTHCNYSSLHLVCSISVVYWLFYREVEVFQRSFLCLKDNSGVIEMVIGQGEKYGGRHLVGKDSQIQRMLLRQKSSNSRRRDRK